MVELRAKILIKTKQEGYGVRIASQLRKMGMDAVVHNSSSISLQSLMYEENFRVILMDYTDDPIPQPETNAQVMALTNDEVSNNYVVHKDGVLFLSRALEIDSICSMIEFYAQNQEQKKYMEQAVTGIIRRMGIQPKFKGYEHLRTTIMCGVQQPELLYRITTDLYDKAAEIHHTNRRNIERTIRTAIDTTYDRTPELLLRSFPYIVGKPSNSDVIALAVDNIRMGMV